MDLTETMIVEDRMISSAQSVNKIWVTIFQNIQVGGEDVTSLTEKVLL